MAFKGDLSHRSHGASDLEYRMLWKPRSNGRQRAGCWRSHGTKDDNVPYVGEVWERRT